MSNVWAGSRDGVPIVLEHTCCDAMSGMDPTLRKEDGKWYATRRYGGWGHGEPDTFTRVLVLFCPFCGERLP